AGDRGRTRSARALLQRRLLCRRHARPAARRRQLRRGLVAPHADLLRSARARDPRGCSHAAPRRLARARDPGRACARDHRRRLRSPKPRLCPRRSRGDAARGRPRGRAVRAQLSRASQALLRSPDRLRPQASPVNASNIPTRDRLAQLRALLRERIVMLDGAMGTLLQGHQLSEADYRGTRFAGHDRQLAGNNDLLSLTQPEIVRDAHRIYFEAGADIVETNTFTSTAIAQADYGLEHLAHELNLAGARLAREAADAMTTPERPRFVAGAIGPTDRTLSLSPDDEYPAYRAIGFATLRRAYDDQIRGLVEGGVDLLLFETIIDTLNVKAAIMAAFDVFDQLGVELPIMISATVTDRSGRILSGQTMTAFWRSVAHAKPLSVGLNCALGAAARRAYVAALAELADCAISCYPNAGLPTAFGEYDELPEQTAAELREFVDSGLVNIIGGCCGTTPEHVRAIAELVRGCRPRPLPEPQAEPELDPELGQDRP